MSQNIDHQREDSFNLPEAHRNLKRDCEYMTLKGKTGELVEAPLELCMDIAGDDIKRVGYFSAYNQIICPTGTSEAVETQMAMTHEEKSFGVKAAGVSVNEVNNNAL